MPDKFYLDSSENSSDEPKDALAWFPTIEVAQQAAADAAIAKPGRIYFIHEVVTSHRLVYKAEATVDVMTEVVDGTPDPS